MGSAATHTKYSPRWGGLSRGWILKETKQRFLTTWKCSTGISEVLEKQLKTRGIPFPPSLCRNPEQ